MNIMHSKRYIPVDVYRSLRTHFVTKVEDKRKKDEKRLSLDGR